jgi:hypothetical protein
LQGQIPNFRKTSCKISESMVSFAFFDYRIASVAIFWGAPASLDSGIIGGFFPCFLTDARPLNSITVLFILISCTVLKNMSWHVFTPVL